MPDIASFHPQIVHFIVVLGFIGVGLRLLTFVVKLEWIRPASTLAPLAAAVSGVLAVRSGDEAHGLAERIPGARTAVQEHEELGERYACNSCTAFPGNGGADRPVEEESLPSGNPWIS